MQRAAAVSNSAARGAPFSKRVRGGQANRKLPFVPPEDWHEPSDTFDEYKIVVQPAGPGYRHVVAPAEVRARLEELPEEFLAPLEVVQFSRMTRKKQSFPCYGMQWGAALYLYPIEASLIERYDSPPKPAQANEARMYGGRWINDEPGLWKLVWTEAAIRDFYLNNILIHELGHLLDDRNERTIDRERFAEWFAVRYGYLPTQGMRARPRTVRRHAK
jgi:hypothetical protein